MNEKYRIVILLNFPMTNYSSKVKLKMKSIINTLLQLFRYRQGNRLDIIEMPLNDDRLIPILVAFFFFFLHFPSYIQPDEIIILSFKILVHIVEILLESIFQI